jgi:hypothetical protein
LKTEKNIDKQIGSSTYRAMATKIKKKKPSPAELLAEVRGRGPAKTYEFEDYIEVVQEMQAKNFSYANIAQFLSERLGYTITRGQVYRAYQTWLEGMKEAEREQEEQEQVESMLNRRDFDPTEREEQEKWRSVTEAKRDLLKYAMDKYPNGSLPVNLVIVFKEVVACLDEKTRDDFEAEKADMQLQSEKDDTKSETKPS